MRRFMLAACVLALSIAAAANESFPFDKYPAEVFHGKPTVPHLETARARDFSTVILKEAKRGPNFAGHYAIVSWGCGTSCGSYVIVDSRSGRVYEPTELSNVELWLRGPVYRVDSTLLVLANCLPPPVYGSKDCERKYYNWDGQKLILLRVEPVSP
jgi:hypothetical protein